jgi:pyroglutamyl-peptidase
MRMVARKQHSHTLWPTVLLTGFDPFGGDTINPSWWVAQALHGRRLSGHRVVAAQLPTRFDDSALLLARLLDRYQPRAVLCLGLAGGREALSLERVAINVSDARIPDNAGAQPVDTPVVPGGPAAYFSSLPIKAITQALQAQGIAAQVSQTAGTFVCNHVFYALMHALAQQPGLNKTVGGFVHVPWLPEQGQPAMALADMVRGIRIAITCSLTLQQDTPIGAGALH